MNLKEHLSQGTLESFLKNELTAQIRSTVRLHLSYCPICREQKDDVALQLAANKMWEEYERSGATADSHIEDRTFRQFWRGEFRDEKLIEQMSRHCVACRDCRRRRELNRIEMEMERARACKWTLSVLLLAVTGFVSRRRRVILGAGTALLLAFVLIRFLPITFVPVNFLPNRQTASKPSPNNAQSDVVIAVPPTSVQNDNRPQAMPTQEPQVASQPQVETQPRRRVPRLDASSPDLLAKAQTIDLTRAPDGAGSRSSANTEDGMKTSFKIIASRLGPTRFRIRLPPGSKRGVYYVSIRDTAFLNEIIPAQGRSSDGVSLPISINMQNLKTDAYILRITRRDKAGVNEYLGDYHVLISRRGSPNERPNGKASGSEQ